MNYLFFDTECAQGRGGICEFGYILLDSDFNVIKAENLLINPHLVFDDYGHHKAGIYFAYSKDEYYSAPDIMDRYDQIAQLLSDKNNMVIGFATDSDAKFLIHDLDRFDLPHVNFVFWDVLKIYKMAGGRDNNLKLDILYSETGGEELMHHEALSDTKMTIEVFKKILTDHNLTTADIIRDFKEASGEVWGGRIIYNDGSVFNYTKGGRTTVANRRILDDFIKNEPISRLSDKFEGQIFSVAPNMVRENFELTMAVCDYAKENGGHFTLSICDAHVLLCDGETKIPKNRLRRNVNLVNVSQMEKIFGLSEGALSKENICLDELIGKISYNQAWYTEYKKAHPKV